jgi:hypothetical protein
MCKELPDTELFTGKWEAICAWERQRMAHEKGLAPPVGSVVVVTKNHKTFCWGYQTAVADTGPAYENEYEKSLLVSSCRHYSMNKGPDSLRRALRRMSLRGTLMNDIRKDFVPQDEPPRIFPLNTKAVLGGDLHDFNCGLWKGKLVCIDFGFHAVLSSRRGPICQAFRRFRHTMA